MQLIKPTLSHIKEMQGVVKSYVEDGIILHRSDEEIANAIRSYVVAVEDGKIIGFASLFIYTPTMAEVRSLVVSKEHQKKGVGRAVVEALIEEGRRLGIKELLTLTYEVGFFKRLGFNELPKEEIWHQKVWEDCIKCKHFPVCNETALTLKI